MPHDIRSINCIRYSIDKDGKECSPGVYYNLDTKKSVKKIKSNQKLTMDIIDGYKIAYIDDNDLKKFDKKKYRDIISNTYYRLTPPGFIQKKDDKHIYKIIDGLQICAKNETDFSIIQ